MENGSRCKTLMSCLGFGTLSETRMSLWARDVWLTQEHYRITRTNTHSHTRRVKNDSGAYVYSLKGSQPWITACVIWHRLSVCSVCICVCVCLCLCVCVTGWCKWDSDSFFFCPPHPVWFLFFKLLIYIVNNWLNLKHKNYLFIIIRHFCMMLDFTVYRFAVLFMDAKLIYITRAGVLD